MRKQSDEREWKYVYFKKTNEKKNPHKGYNISDSFNFFVSFILYLPRHEGFMKGRRRVERELKSLCLAREMRGKEGRGGGYSLSNGPLKLITLKVGEREGKKKKKEYE